MTLVNDSVLVTPGSGATIAAHSPGGSNTTEYQVQILANAVGQLYGTQPTYGLNIPQLLVGANVYHWEFFNHPSSGKTVVVKGIWPIPELSQANAGIVVPRFELFRTTAVSSGGTASTSESNTTTVANFFRLNPTDTSLSSHISAKTRLTSITTGTFLWPCYVASAVSALIGGAVNAAVAAQMQGMNLIPQREFGQELTIPPAQGIVMRQGTVASVGSVGWLLEFTIDP